MYEKTCRIPHAFKNFIQAKKLKKNLIWSFKSLEIKQPKKWNKHALFIIRLYFSIKTEYTVVKIFRF